MMYCNRILHHKFSMVLFMVEQMLNCAQNPSTFCFDTTFPPLLLVCNVAAVWCLLLFIALVAGGSLGKDKDDVAKVCESLSAALPHDRPVHLLGEFAPNNEYILLFSSFIQGEVSDYLSRQPYTHTCMHVHSLCGIVYVRRELNVSVTPFRNRWRRACEEMRCVRNRYFRCNLSDAERASWNHPCTVRATHAALCACNFKIKWNIYNVHLHSNYVYKRQYICN